MNSAYQRRMTGCPPMSRPVRRLNTIPDRSPNLTIASPKAFSAGRQSSAGCTPRAHSSPMERPSGLFMRPFNVSTVAPIQPLPLICRRPARASNERSSRVHVSQKPLTESTVVSWPQRTQTLELVQLPAGHTVSDVARGTRRVRVLEETDELDRVREACDEPVAHVAIEPRRLSGCMAPHNKKGRRPGLGIRRPAGPFASMSVLEKLPNSVQ